MQSNHFLKKYCLGAPDVLEGLTGHRVGKKTDEITWMARFEGHTDLTVSLEASNPRTMAGTGIDDDEWTPRLIDFNSGRWNDAREYVIHWLIKPPAVDYKLDLIIEHMRRRLGEMLAILVAALVHDVPKQNATLRGIDAILDRGAEHAQRRAVEFIGLR
jgi:hypothetical protein